MKIRSLFIFLSCIGLVASCSRVEVIPTNPSVEVRHTARVSTGFPESFESGTKTGYAAANVTLGSGSWNLSDALLGDLSTDVKNGAKAARVRNSGKLTMQFDLTAGAGTVTIQHARFGSDGNGNWGLWYSTNGGSSYNQAGSSVSTTTTSLQTATFTLNVSGNVRLEIRKTDGGSNRINFDDISVTDYGDSSGGTVSKKFLFDASKAETAGNADWVIDQDNGTPQRIPTPAQSGITATTAETYWMGAVSAWGVALVKLGHTVETLPVGAGITYGSTSNPQDLSKYDVFVVDEPNILFTAAEKTAIMTFVQNGGGLMMISDHTISDRNNDGEDSPEIWNDLMQNNSVQANAFGFLLDLNNITETTSNVKASTSDPVLNGSQGNVTQLAFHNGATLTLNTSNNASVKGLIWRTSATGQGNTNVMCASSTFGSGRVVVVGDSSPADDGTGAPGNKLYDGWTEVNGNHARLHLNASLWLAKAQ